MTGTVCTKDKLLDMLGGPQPEGLAFQHLIETMFGGSATPGTEPPAGNKGEQLEAELLAANKVSLVTNTPKTVLSITLTPGIWDVSGSVTFVPTATTSITYLSASISDTTNTHGANKNRKSLATAAVVPGATNVPIMDTPTARINISASTTYYLVATGVFTVDTLQAYGFLRALRVA